MLQQIVPVPSLSSSAYRRALGPENLTLVMLGVLWGTVAVGLVVGFGGVAGSALQAALIAWAGAAAVDELDRYSAVSARSAAVARVAVVGAVWLWHANFGAFHAGPLQASGFVTTVLAFFGVAALGAPVLGGYRGAILRRRVRDLTPVAAAVGCAIFAGMLPVMVGARFGFAPGPGYFPDLLLVLGFGLVPCILTAKAALARDASASSELRFSAWIESPSKTFARPPTASVDT